MRVTAVMTTLTIVASLASGTQALAQPQPPPQPRYWSGGGDWALLGETTIQGRRDVDVIRVGREQGRFRKILMTVENADMVLYGFRVTFMNGEIYDQNVNVAFREGSRSSAFDLPGDARVIDNIVVYARDLRGGGRPLLRLWGERGRGPANPPGGVVVPPPPPGVAVPPPPQPRYWTGGGEWVLLGEATIQGRRDVDVVRVGREQGRFTKILMTVENADMVLYGFRVTFKNGEVFDQNLNVPFREGSRSSAFDLPGDARTIESIAIFARDLRGGGHPLLRVWGEKGRGGHGDGFGRYGGWTWQSLGMVTADARRDVDTIQVGPRERRFRAIQIAVHDSDLQMFDIVVQFMNGETFRPQVRPFFREGSRSQVIDLPGDARAIQSVTFRYRDLGRHDGRAKVELLAR
jgi:hypothetical protein